MKFKINEDLKLIREMLELSQDEGFKERLNYDFYLNYLLPKF